MKEILIVGSDEAIGLALTHRMKSRGYKIKKARNFLKAIKILKRSSPDFVLCAGRISVDKEGQYAIEL